MRCMRPLTLDHSISLYFYFPRSRSHLWVSSWDRGKSDKSFVYVRAREIGARSVSRDVTFCFGLRWEISLSQVPCLFEAITLIPKPQIFYLDAWCGLELSFQDSVLLSVWTLSRALSAKTVKRALSLTASGGHGVIDNRLCLSLISVTTIFPPWRTWLPSSRTSGPAYSRRAQHPLSLWPPTQHLPHSSSSSSYFSSRHTVSTLWFSQSSPQRYGGRSTGLPKKCAKNRPVKRKRKEKKEL